MSARAFTPSAFAAVVAKGVVAGVFLAFLLCAINIFRARLRQSGSFYSIQSLFLAYMGDLRETAASLMHLNHEASSFVSGSLHSPVMLWVSFAICCAIHLAASARKSN